MPVNMKHKHSSSEHAKLYTQRTNMIQRCHNENHKSFKQYGQRGIQVCQAWRDSWDAYAEWALANGYEPGLSVDRIDNDGNYEPGNVRFVPMSENRPHSRIHPRDRIRWPEPLRPQVSQLPFREVSGREFADMVIAGAYVGDCFVSG